MDQNIIKECSNPLYPSVWQWLKSRIFLQHLEWHSNQMPERLWKQLHFPPLCFSPETVPARHHICTFRHQDDWQSDSGTLREWTNSERKRALCVFCMTWLNISVNIVMFVRHTDGTRWSALQRPATVLLSVLSAGTDTRQRCVSVFKKLQHFLQHQIFLL